MFKSSRGSASSIAFVGVSVETVVSVFCVNQPERRLLRACCVTGRVGVVLLLVADALVDIVRECRLSGVAVKDGL